MSHIRHSILYFYMFWPSAKQFPCLLYFWDKLFNYNIFKFNSFKYTYIYFIFDWKFGMGLIIEIILFTLIAHQEFAIQFIWISN